MDFLLTEKGDLLLEEVDLKAQPITLNFFIESQNQAICLKFDFEERLIPVANQGLKIDFSIKQYDIMYKAQTIDEEKMLNQMCYNAIRTQKNSLSHAINYGSYFYKYKNKKVTSGLLKELETIAKECISIFAPEALIEASVIPTNNGVAIIQFNVQIYRHTFTLDYFI